MRLASDYLRKKMKTVLLLLATLALGACSTFNGAQGSATTQSHTDKPYSLLTPDPSDPFNPDDPYNGG
jgi:ABC-type oligopeptide transport system substrate-binding subunit